MLGHEYDIWGRSEYKVAWGEEVAHQKEIDDGMKDLKARFKKQSNKGGK